MNQTKTKIETMLNPKTIAVIGASADKSKIGHQILFNLMRDGFRGRLYPVNPDGGRILGLDVATEIGSVDADIDLAIIVIPRNAVWPVVAECADAKVKSIVIISAGFGEFDEEGKILQEKISEVCARAGIALLGPNCLGLLSTPNHLNASFANSMPKSGNVALVSQSGAVITSLVDWSLLHEIGFSHIFSLGNKAGLNEADFLEYLYQDPNTSSVVMYLENLKVSEKLISVLKKGTPKKPTVVLIGGSSSHGTKTAMSHTGSVVSSYIGIKTFLEQAGVIVVDNYSRLYTLMTAFAAHSKKVENAFVIITNAGGPSIAVCDSMAAHHLDLVSWNKSVESKMKTLIGDRAVCANPIDLIGDATSVEYRRAIAVVESDTSASVAILIVTPQTVTDVEKIATLIADYKGRLLLLPCFIGGVDMAKAVKIVSHSGKAVYQTPDEVVAAARALVTFSKIEPRIDYLSPREKFFAKKDIIKTLRQYNLPYLPYYLVQSRDEALSKARSLGYPVVLKTADPNINHKSESKAVRLNIASDQDLLLHLHQLGGKAIIGKMIKSKADIFLGIKKDTSVGNIILFGSGGVYAELYQDFSRRVAPVSLPEIKKMIHETKIGQVFDGYRGVLRGDIDLLARIIKSAEKFVNDHSNILEVDFNPILFDGRSYHIVDLRIIGEKDEETIR